MKLNLKDLRIIIDALETKHGVLEQALAQLDESQENEYADLGNDLYALEILQGCVQDEYQQRLQRIAEKTPSKIEKKQPVQDDVYVCNPKIRLKQPMEMS